ncbi:hypothetical protein ACH4ZX_08105 [Streptomyces sp. NPDC020490]|uniref:hypothetical protein n=1 Tax=Streptomyces sp. NPDC020490 TaxID=3365078 RepID=UPI0037AE32FC
MTAVAAYFADALRAGADRGHAIPGAPGLAALHETASKLARQTEDEQVRHLATAIAQAHQTKT